MERRRSKPLLTLKDRLALYANELRERASLLPPGIERDILLKKARQADTASQLEGWADSPRLQSPKEGRLSGGLFHSRTI
jgi:hypothetical protein